MSFKKVQLVLLIISLALSSCAEKQMIDGFNNNIKEVKEFHEFEEYSSETLENKVDEHTKKASINFKNLKVSILSKLLSIIYNMNIQAEYLFDQNNLTISMDLQDVSLDQIFEYLTEAYNIGYKQTTFGYLIYFPQLKTKIFTIDYHNFNRNASSAMSISSSQLNKSTDSKQQNYSMIETKSQEAFWDNLEKTLNILISDPSKPVISDNKQSNQVSIYRESGIVLVKAYPRTLQVVESFLNQINDNSIKQIVIEAKILEITLNEEFSSGIQWELLKKKLYMTSFNAVTSPLQDTNKLFNNTNLVSSNVPESNIISAKFSNGTDFKSVIQALSSQGKISVLSSPRVATLNNQRALIKYGDDKYYITNVTNIAVNSVQNGTSSQSGFNLEPFFSGIALDATPNIVRDNQIVMHIHPIITRVEDDSKTIQIDDKNTKIPIAKIQSREADTIVKAFSGDIIILGGLTQGQFNINSSGLPFKEGSALYKLFAPFRSKQNSSSRTELVILLKPTIIQGGSGDITSELEKYFIDN